MSSHFSRQKFLKTNLHKPKYQKCKFTLADFYGRIGSRTFQSFIIVVGKSYFGLIQDQLVHFFHTIENAY